MQDWPAPKLKGRNLDAGMRCRWIRRPTSGKAGERSDGAQSGEGVRRVTPHDIESCTTRLVDPLPKAPAIAMMKDLENDPGWIVQTRGSNPLRRLHPVNPIDPSYPASSLGSLRCTRTIHADGRKPSSMSSAHIEPGVLHGNVIHDHAHKAVAVSIYIFPQCIEQD